MTRTSDSDPIRVDFVPQAAHGLSGRLGLTFAPGKCGRGVYANWDRDLEKDLARLRDHYRATLLVTLIEKFEMIRASIPELIPAVKRAGMRSIWFLITDVSRPRFPEDPIPLVREIHDDLAAGGTVVAAFAGVGRESSGRVPRPVWMACNCVLLSSTYAPHGHRPNRWPL